MVSPKEKRRRLRQLIDGENILIVPGAYDCITARLIEYMGFDSVYMTGSGVAMSVLGTSDVGVITLTEAAQRAGQISASVELPVIADMDTGFGGPLSIIRSTEEFEKAGVAAVHIEDQMMPKRCGHELGRRVVSQAEMVGRIHACVDARKDEDFLIIARTDARTGLGIDEAINRGLAYADAGADVIFVESPETVDELELIGSNINKPKLVNMVEGGRTPFLPATKLQEIGFDVVIFPNTLTRILCKVGMEILGELKYRGTTSQFHNKMLSHNQLFELFRFQELVDLEGKYMEPLR